MQYTLGEKYNSQYHTIVALVRAIVGSENRLHMHLHVLATKGLTDERCYGTTNRLPNLWAVLQ